MGVLQEAELKRKLEESLMDVRYIIGGPPSHGHQRQFGKLRPKPLTVPLEPIGTQELCDLIHRVLEDVASARGQRLRCGYFRAPQFPCELALSPEHLVPSAVALI